MTNSESGKLKVITVNQILVIIRIVIIINGIIMIHVQWPPFVLRMWLKEMASREGIYRFRRLTNTYAVDSGHGIGGYVELY
jgi:hypothetical protein